MAFTRELRKSFKQMRGLHPDVLEDMLEEDPDIQKVLRGAKIIQRTGPGGRKPTTKAKGRIFTKQNK